MHPSLWETNDDRQDLITNAGQEGLPPGQLVTSTVCLKRLETCNLLSPASSWELEHWQAESAALVACVHKGVGILQPKLPHLVLGALRGTMKESIDLGLLFLFFSNPFWKKTCGRWLGEGVCERGESSGDVSSYHYGN